MQSTHAQILELLSLEKLEGLVLQCLLETLNLAFFDGNEFRMLSSLSPAGGWFVGGPPRAGPRLHLAPRRPWIAGCLFSPNVGLGTAIERGGAGRSLATSAPAIGSVKLTGGVADAGDSSPWRGSLLCRVLWFGAWDSSPARAALGECESRRFFCLTWQLGVVIVRRPIGERPFLITHRGAKNLTDPEAQCPLPPKKNLVPCQRQPARGMAYF